MTDLRSDPSVYLFPECNDDNDLTRYLKESYEEIVEQELESWDRLEETWPKDRSFNAFQRWFDYRIHWMICDLADQPLSRGLLRFCLVDHDAAAFHHPTDVVDHRIDVLKRIAFDRGDVGEVAGL